MAVPSRIAFFISRIVRYLICRKIFYYSQGLKTKKKTKHDLRVVRTGRISTNNNT